jgi:hypothetical protein
MKNFILVFNFIILTTVVSFSQKETISYGGVKFYTELNESGEKLVLNGIGIREKYFFDLYVCGLYLDKKTSDEKAIIQSPKTMIISIRIISSKVNKEVFLEAVNEGFQKATGAKASKEQIAKFCSFFKEEFKVGDKIQLIYTPDKGVTIEKNNVSLGVIQGLEFKKALFSIWLGNQPADENLKLKLLGK